MNEFLSNDKRGHCEYFATALTLALRELGIPSRYSTGYMVDEKKRVKVKIFIGSELKMHMLGLYIGMGKPGRQPMQLHIVLMLLINTDLIHI